MYHHADSEWGHGIPRSHRLACTYERAWPSMMLKRSRRNQLLSLLDLQCISMVIRELQLNSSRRWSCCCCDGTAGTGARGMGSKWSILLNLRWIPITIHPVLYKGASMEVDWHGLLTSICSLLFLPRHSHPLIAPPCRTSPWGASRLKEGWAGRESTLIAIHSTKRIVLLREEFRLSRGRSQNE